MRHSSSVVLCLVAATACRPIVEGGAAPGPLPSAETLIAESARAEGGRDAILAQKSFRMRGTFVVEAQKVRGAFMAEAQAPNKGRTRLVLGQTTSESGFDGTHAWRIGFDGEPKLLYGQALAAAAREGDLYLLADWERHYETPRVLGRRLFDGRTVFEVELRPKGAPHPERWMIDVETRLRIGIIRWEYGDNQQESTTIFRDWRPCGNLVCPRELEVVGDGGFKVAIERVEFDVPTDPIQLPPSLVEAARPRRMLGLVTLDGQPQANADVRVEIEEAEVKVARTNDAGRFEITGLRGHRYRVHAAAHFALGMVAGSFPPKGDIEGVTIPLEIGGKVKGLVLNETGAPITGANIYPSSGCIIYDPHRSDERGAIDFLIEPGNYSVTFAAPGFIPERMALEVGAGKTIETTVKLQREAPLRGVVVDEAGNPVSGVQLGVDENRGESGARAALKNVHPRATSDAEGRFSIPELRRGPQRVYVLGRGTQAPIPVTLPHEDLRVVLSGMTQLRGVVLRADESPVPGAEISIQPISEPREIDARTDANGRFEFKAIPAGDYRITAYLPGPTIRSIKQDISVTHGDARELRLVAPGGLSITGVVLDASGAPAAGAQVSASSAIDTLQSRDVAEYTFGGGITNAEGRFEIVDLKPGLYQLEVARTGERGADILRHEVRAGTQAIELRFSRSVVIKGRVRGPRGPVAQFDIDSFGERDSGGIFSRRIRLRDGPREVTFWADGLVPKRVRIEPEPGQDEIDLGVVQLELGRRVQGRILRAKDRTPVADAYVQPGRAGDRFRPGVASDQQGRFMLDGQPEGEAVLRINSRSHPEKEIRVPARSSEIEILLDEGGRIVGTVTGEQGEPIRRASVLYAAKDGPAGTTDDQGRFELEGVPPGRVTLSVSTLPGMDAFELKEVEVFVGKETKVDIRPRKGTTIHPRIRLSGGEVLTQLGPIMGLVPGQPKLPDEVGDVSHFVRRFGYSASRTPRGDAVVIPSVPAGVYTFVFTRYAGLKPYLYTQPVTVVAGEDVTLEVQLPDQLMPLRSHLGDDL